ncbi:MAG: TetR/AcrR family transcriptional regulator [Deltaproteobacteria bacterium]|nr:TetR/AcrR family transcriptional regulator [Deltaproteobacteria bacterium]
MKQIRDAEKTREKILKCATKVFSKQGFEGASLSTILKEAGVNKRMVYHYYGSKEGLYHAVHIRQWHLLGQWFATELLPPGKPNPASTKEMLFRALEIFHDFSASHHEFVRLLMWDGLEGGKVSKALWKDIRGPLFHKIAALLDAAKAEGTLSKGLKADHLVISFMGVILVYFSHAESLEDMFGGKSLLKPKAAQERKEQVMKLFDRIFLD